MFQFRCPQCQALVTAGRGVAGAKMPCPSCGQRLQVPVPRNQTVLAQPVDDSPSPRGWMAPAGAGVAVLAAGVVAGILLWPARKPRLAPLPSPPAGAEETPAASRLAPPAPAPVETPVPPPAPSSEVPPPETGELARKAYAVLQKHCYRCHGEDGAAEGGFNYVLDRDQLLARKKLLPGDAARSKLYRRLQSGEMPPEGETPRPTEDDFRVVRQWIEAGAPADRPTPPSRTFVSAGDVHAALLDDILSVEPRQRRFVRYFSLAHLYNAGLSEDELQTYRHALSKLVNSLSWRPGIVVPRPVGRARTLFRIDVRDYRWSAAVWERIAAAYPYGVRADGPTAQAVAAAAECEQPCVRADWFVATAARPPLYHELLQMPDGDRELEAQLKIDVAADIEQEHVARAGFNGSGVSRNNRLIERHELPFGGAYWKSYDFDDNLGRHNLFAHPFGPGSRPNDFAPAGGEILFNLPNGLQGYMLVNARGRRIDKGPTAIVSDPRRPDRAVENGLSCMSCHTRGVLPKADQVRAHAEKNRDAFSAEEIQLIKALYPPEDRFRALQAQDAERFRAAVLKTGSPVGATEPIVSLALQFEGELDLARAAAEVGCVPDEFRKRLAESGDLARALGPLKVPGGTIHRQVFTAAFAETVRRLELGTPARRPSD